MSINAIEGNIVEEYKIGNTTIKIADDACKDKTPEEIDNILSKLMAIGWECVRAARSAGKDV